jgi:hypothetical protein
MKGNGKTIKPMGRVNFGMLMAIIMKVSGEAIERMVLVFIYIQMGHDMKGNGWKIYNMELEKSHGPTIPNMKDHIDLGKSRDSVLTDGPTDLHIQECGTITN